MSHTTLPRPTPVPPCEVRGTGCEVPPNSAPRTPHRGWAALLGLGLALALPACTGETALARGPVTTVAAAGASNPTQAT